MKLSFYKLIGKGYGRGWWTNCKVRKRIFKGARNTKKSYVIEGLEILNKIITQPLRNVLILRNTNTSNRDSTFPTICKLICQPDASNPSITFSQYFKINNQDMTITYKPTGQVILFRGFDSPDKLQSIRVVHGFLTDVYVEEAFEIKDYEEWRRFEGSIRGKLPEGYFHQITFCLNAWDVGHWIYEKYFKGRFEDDLNYLMTHDYQDYYDEDFIDDYGKGLYLHTSTYKINEFRDTEIYDIAMENLRMVAPEIYKVEALGMWGNSTESTYPEWSDGLIINRVSATNYYYSYYAIGIDTGLSNGEGKIEYSKDKRIKSATTMQLVGLTNDYSKIVCIDEFFYSNEAQMVKKTEPQLMDDIIDKLIEWKNIIYLTHPQIMKGIIPVYVDCADIGFRQGLELVARKKGLFNISFQASTKLRIQTRVDFIRLIMAMNEFLISENCKNLIREIKASKKGAKGQPREDIDDHSINANEYGWASFIKKLRRWGEFKEH